MFKDIKGIEVKAGDTIKTARGAILNIVDENGKLFYQSVANDQKTELEKLNIKFEILKTTKI